MVANMEMNNIENTDETAANTSAARVSKDKMYMKWFRRGIFIGILATVMGILIGLVIGTAGNYIVSCIRGTNHASDTVVNDEAVKKLKTLEQVIDERFYFDDVTDEELRTGMYKGLLEALGDPYSEYYTAEEMENIMEQSQGIYYGIGAYVGLDEDTKLPVINSVIENSPAQDVDLHPNDLIYEISGTSAYGMTLTEAVSLIKGPEGTDVVLKIIREGEKDYLTITLTRRKVETPTVKCSVEEDIAYIQVAEFDDVTVGQFSDALETAKEAKAKGILLDLRGNPGGNLSAVVDMCRMILPEGMIVYTEEKDGKRSEYTCDGTNQLTLPLVVLVDGNSASAAEIMAGAIKDYKLGTLVGTNTFGKGIVQQIIPFKDGTAVKVTISAYFTPNGNNIHGIGIEPDIVCEFDGEAYYGSEEHPDNQLEKGKEVLRNLF